MRWGARLLAAATLSAVAGDAGAEVFPASLTCEVIPQRIVGEGSGQVLITIASSGRVEGLRARLVAPPGFIVEPAEFVFDSIAGTLIKTANLRPVGGEARRGEQPILVEATRRDSAEKATAIARANFTYEPQISMSLYLLLGLLGVIVGYGLRFLQKILSSVPAPSPAPEELVVSSGPITQWVARNYYFVDFSVTVALGFLALLYLAQTGSPPEAASYWPGALTFGVGLGALTNSELFTKLGR
jgi:hypothetical protein